MTSDFSHLQQLAERARGGEGEAAARLHQMIAPALLRIVRRALGGGGVPGPLGRHIQAELRRALADRPPGDPEGLARRVAERLCDNLLRRAPEAGLAARCRAETTPA